MAKAIMITIKLYFYYCKYYLFIFFSFVLFFIIFFRYLGWP